MLFWHLLYLDQTFRRVEKLSNTIEELKMNVGWQQRMRGMMFDMEGRAAEVAAALGLPEDQEAMVLRVMYGSHNTDPEPSAQEVLRDLREGGCLFYYMLSKLPTDSDALRAIGTSPEELNMLEREYNAEAAAHDLELIKTGKTGAWRHFLFHLEAGKLEPESVGTTAEELLTIPKDEGHQEKLTALLRPNTS
ncbi:MAG: hypothetical protein A3D26_02665 [Candidatus Blackburnbacteria bacterium RIFCSPHIGHO2_02_FULL_44_20]|uniref:Uncharacterized protein n=1 Tax=Candidatus Blackburnbacteria bacterium RIFCSPHIGHO2_02_FULL_44_20 TaxID=1797516 RepID=A0A1G1V7X3_9BACT|nr:MAG: hypothetical protein A3E16_03470 [Candidatus Blackburnbacteria bacterium RIFCSPHIGHO2_12_FULL_44_25]OGY11381.1 MAG: hypothetical protein A3D26_02665 [Candidatus Blackburnbacteria bacterium RIFCSPHIGHO2_02_FULL_44_20]